MPFVLYKQHTSVDRLPVLPHVVFPESVTTIRMRAYSVGSRVMHPRLVPVVLICGLSSYVATIYRTRIACIMVLFELVLFCCRGLRVVSPTSVPDTVEPPVLTRAERLRQVFNR